ncbi:unnamed protein product [Meloidogyne enterolobii]|uniref:Uncharacterized protein n=1 Tax=Meloidogyne enterolobii TaxID=390850 RepID=A0ACB0YG64_MELEN
MTRLISGEIHLYLLDLNENGQCKEMDLVRVSAAYQRQVGDYAAYYVEALRYLGCEDLENLKMSEREEYALLLCVAALLGEGVYNFGELLAHPILEALMGGPKEWIVNALYALNAGDWNEFDKMAARHPPKQRNLSFANIAKTAHLEEDQVELLVMKALANDLIKGHIDQV